MRLLKVSEYFICDGWFLYKHSLLSFSSSLSVYFSFVHFQCDVCSCNFFPSMMKTNICFVQTDKFIVNEFRCLARYHWSVFRALNLCTFVDISATGVYIFIHIIGLNVGISQALSIFGVVLSWMRNSDALQPFLLLANPFQMREEKCRQRTTNFSVIKSLIMEHNNREKKSKQFHIMCSLYNCCVSICRILFTFFWSIFGVCDRERECVWWLKCAYDEGFKVWRTTSISSHHRQWA